MEPLEAESNQEQIQQQSQTFIPSFTPYHNPPLGHSRPFYYQQEGAYSHRPSAYQQQLGFDTPSRFSGYKSDNLNAHSSGSEGILGSGNFGILRGGTFYSDSDGETSNYEEYNPYYQNGHGRPQFYFGGNPPARQHEQFANFRDFADINTPSNSAYSQYVVVYANKNSSHTGEIGKIITQPKNIIEHLAMLDLETPKSSPETISDKKVSKSKRKLGQIPPEKKVKHKKSSDLYEPLLALS